MVWTDPSNNKPCLAFREHSFITFTDHHLKLAHYQKFHKYMQWVANSGSKTSELMRLLKKQKRSVKVHKNSHNTPSKLSVHSLLLICVEEEKKDSWGKKVCLKASPASLYQPSLATLLPLFLFIQVRTEASLLWHRCVVTLYCPRSSCL